MPPREFDSEDMARRGRIGALTKASRYDRAQLTDAARAAFMLRFVSEVDPNLELAPDERHRRALALLRAHMAKLARGSAQRRANGAKQRRQAAIDAEIDQAAEHELGEANDG
jgi:hypothetical protein